MNSIDLLRFQMTKLGITIVAALLVLGCQPDRPNTPANNDPVNTPATGEVTVTGRLLEVKDDRPADGGIDLTVETEGGTREILRVGSAFIAGPREAVLALHQVVDAAKVGDRLKATGRRDEGGALIVERLEIVR